MIQAHCLLNCLASPLPKRYDVRPLFFGSWDAPFTVTRDGVISYYSTTISHDDYLRYFEMLYGYQVQSWYRYKLSKEENFRIFLQRLATSTTDTHIIVQLDLYYLPYEKRSFRKMHRPHYVIVQPREDTWQIIDPYFNWEGSVPEEVIKQAFYQNAIGGGFCIQTSRLQPPSDHTAGVLFEEVFDINQNPLTGNVLRILERIEHHHGLTMADLPTCFAQVGIIAQRKSSYQYALSYFSHGEDRTDEDQNYVHQLTKNWNAFGFLCIKASLHQKTEDVLKLKQKVHDLEQQEKQLKQRLWERYESWKVYHE